MSNNAIDAVKYCSKSRGPARLVLLMIADGVSTTTECYRPRNGLASLASLCNCTERNLRHQMYGRKDKDGVVQGGLVQLGELVIEETPGRPSRYYLPILEGEPGYEPTECHAEHICNGFHTPVDRLRDDIKRDATARRRADQRKAHPGTPVPPDPGTDVPPSPRNTSTPGNNRSAPPEQVFRPGGNNRSAPPEQVFRTSPHMSQDLPIETHAPSPALEKEMEQSRNPVRVAELQFWCRNTPRGRVAMAPYLERANGRERFSDMVAAWNAAHPERLWAVQQDRGELTTGPGIEPMRAS